MRSALSIVAFSNATQLDGTIALLETALASLDRVGNKVAAAYVDSALFLLKNESEQDDVKIIYAAAH